MIDRKRVNGDHAVAGRCGQHRVRSKVTAQVSRIVNYFLHILYFKTRNKVYKINIMFKELVQCPWSLFLFHYLVCQFASPTVSLSVLTGYPFGRLPLLFAIIRLLL